MTASLPARFRLFQSLDFADLYQIEKICFQPPHRFTRRYMRELTTSSSSATWIAEQNGRMAGFAVLEWAEQGSRFLAYIATIEVLPEFRHKGLGAGLMHCLESSANSNHAVAIWLHVNPENRSAIGLYDRLGYTRNGVVEHYYARNRPAAVFVKRLA